MNTKSQTDQSDALLPNGHSSHVPISHKIDAALVATAYQQGHIGLGVILLSATLIFVGLYDSPQRAILFGWYISLLGILAFRYISIEMFKKVNLLKANFVFWKSLFITGVALSGIAWGFLASVLLPYENLGQLSLTLFVMATITSGAVPRLCSIPSAGYIFITAALAPLCVRFLSLPYENFDLFAGALIIYYVYLMMMASSSYKMIKNSIALQFENDLLLENLSAAKKELEASNVKLEHAARHDPLTNLANRSLFEINFENAIWRAQQDNKILSLLYLDIDNFKEVNDAYGHHVGDQLLQKVVQRIKRKLPDHVIASRLGGDELTIIIENVNDLEEIADLCRKICETIAKPFEIQDFCVSITTSIGISFYPVDGLNLEMLVKTADKAMYRSKAAGGNNFHFNTDFTTLKFALTNAFKHENMVKSIKS